MNMAYPDSEDMPDSYRPFPTTFCGERYFNITNRHGNEITILECEFDDVSHNYVTSSELVKLGLGRLLDQ